MNENRENKINLEERLLAVLLEEVCAEEGVSYSRMAGDWIHVLEKDGKMRYVMGYQFDRNKSAVSRMAADKSATIEILKRKKVPTVDGYLHLHPKKEAYQYVQGDYSSLEGFIDKNKYPLVVKSNRGSSGHLVRFVGSGSALDKAVAEIFESGQDVLLSSYVDIKNEYRVVMSGGQPQFIYKKIRSTIVADGRATLGELIDLKDGDYSFYKLVFGLDEKDVVPVGMSIPADVRHNLSQGAVPEVLDLHDYGEIIDLAKRTYDVLPLDLCAVDCVEDSQGNVMVLEVNSGVTYQKLVHHIPKARELAKEVYRKAVQGMFSE